MKVVYFVTDAPTPTRGGRLDDKMKSIMFFLKNNVVPKVRNRLQRGERVLYKFGCVSARDGATGDYKTVDIPLESDPYNGDNPGVNIQNHSFCRGHPAPAKARPLQTL